LRVQGALVRLKAHRIIFQQEIIVRHAVLPCSSTPFGCLLEASPVRPFLVGGESMADENRLLCKY
jgi:hypothetical protein